MGQLPRILIVDDEPDIREIMRSHVATVIEADMHEASNGAEAIIQIKQQDFDLIICDIRMPKLSGIELLDWLRNQNRMTPFAIITSFNDRPLILEAITHGASKILSKPFQMTDIKQLIEELLLKSPSE